jgi:hypothetical protein
MTSEFSVFGKSFIRKDAVEKVKEIKYVNITAQIYANS